MRVPGDWNIQTFQSPRTSREGDSLLRGFRHAWRPGFVIVVFLTEIRLAPLCKRRRPLVIILALAQMGVEIAMNFGALFPTLDSVEKLVFDEFYRMRCNEPSVTVDRRCQLDAIVDQFVGLADFLHKTETKCRICIDHLAGEGRSEERR